MKHVIPHGLDPVLAKKVVDAAFKNYLERFAQYSPVLKWSDEANATVSFSAKGLGITGRFSLVPGALEVEMEVQEVGKVVRQQVVDKEAEVAAEVPVGEKES